MFMDVILILWLTFTSIFSSFYMLQHLYIRINLLKSNLKACPECEQIGTSFDYLTSNELFPHKFVLLTFHSRKSYTQETI